VTTYPTAVTQGLEAGKVGFSDWTVPSKLHFELLIPAAPSSAKKGNLIKRKEGTGGRGWQATHPQTRQ